MPDDKLLDFIQANYQLASAELALNSHHASVHWRVFNQKFSDYFNHPEMWSDFRNNAISRGLDDSNPHEALSIPEDFLKIMEQAVAELSTLMDEKFPDLLEESAVGRPNTIPMGGKNLSITSFDQVFFAWQIYQSVGRNPNLPLLFLEIGGGFGGLIRVLKLVFPKARFISVDLPEGNALSTYFLKKNFPESPLFTLTDLRAGKMLDWGQCDFAILPGWCLESITDGIIDYTINTRSMMEMNLSTINWYFSQIERLSKVGGLFYCVNRYHKQIGGEQIILADYPFDACWDFLYSQPKILQPHIHQLIARRRSSPNPRFPHPELQALPRP